MRDRTERERRTVGVMVGMYCRRFHGAPSAGGLCPDCSRLLDYALERIARCPHGPDKPVCSGCSIHCYRRGERESIRGVMRWAGPRMILSHPRLAIAHLSDRRRRT